jgi:RecA/RadA recombinase
VLSIDTALGHGLPAGITEITGEASVGKTALIGRIIADTQETDVPVALVSPDYLDKPYLRNLGVQLKKLYILPSADDEFTELVFGRERGFLRVADKVLLVVDPLNGIRPEKELPGHWNDMMFWFLSQVRNALGPESSCVVTTQVRAKTSADPGKLFSGGTDTSAKRLTDLFDARLEISRTGVGEYLYTMGVDIKKNTGAPPARYLEVPATKGHGVEVELDFVRVAKSRGVIDLRGPRMFFGSRFLGMGERGAAQLLMRDRRLQEEILDGIFKR